MQNIGFENLFVIYFATKTHSLPFGDSLLP